MTSSSTDPLADLSRHGKLGPEWMQADGDPVSDKNYEYEESDPGSRADHVRTRLGLLAKEWDPAKYVFLLPDFPHDLEDGAESFRVIVSRRRENS